MSAIGPIVPGLPGFRSTMTAQHRVVFRQSLPTFLAGGRVIDGTKSRDPGNDDPTRLRAGLLMGKVTSTGLYAPSIIGLTQASYTSGGTSLTLTPAAAAELVRRNGPSGTFLTVGPPTAAGVVASTQTTYSAVNTTTGVVTVSSLGVNKVTKVVIALEDGTADPVTFLPDGYPIPVTDASGTALNVQFPQIPVAGIVDTANLVDWPEDASLITYLQEKLSRLVGGKYVFSDKV
jgi:hypothetical protein